MTTENLSSLQERQLKLQRAKERLIDYGTVLDQRANTIPSSTEDVHQIIQAASKKIRLLEVLPRIDQRIEILIDKIQKHPEISEYEGKVKSIEQMVKLGAYPPSHQERFLVLAQRVLDQIRVPDSRKIDTIESTSVSAEDLTNRYHPSESRLKKVPYTHTYTEKKKVTYNFRGHEITNLTPFNKKFLTYLDQELSLGHSPEYGGAAIYLYGADTFENRNRVSAALSYLKMLVNNQATSIKLDSRRTRNGNRWEPTKIIVTGLSTNEPTQTQSERSSNEGVNVRYEEDTEFNQKLDKLTQSQKEAFLHLLQNGEQPSKTEDLIKTIFSKEVSEGTPINDLKDRFHNWRSNAARTYERRLNFKLVNVSEEGGDGQYVLRPVNQQKPEQPQAEPKSEASSQTEQPASPQDGEYIPYEPDPEDLRSPLENILLAKMVYATTHNFLDVKKLYLDLLPYLPTEPSPRPGQIRIPFITASEIIQTLSQTIRKLELDMQMQLRRAQLTDKDLELWEKLQSEIQRTRARSLEGWLMRVRTQFNRVHSAFIEDIDPKDRTPKYFLKPDNVINK